MEVIALNIQFSNFQLHKWINNTNRTLRNSDVNQQDSQLKKISVYLLVLQSNITNEQIAD